MVSELPRIGDGHGGKNTPHQITIAEIVMVTGHNDLSTVVSGVREGAYDYIVKSLSWKRLLEAIEAALIHRRAGPVMKQKRTFHGVKSVRTTGSDGRPI